MIGTDSALVATYPDITGSWNFSNHYSGFCFTHPFSSTEEAQEYMRYVHGEVKKYSVQSNVAPLGSKTYSVVVSDHNDVMRVAGNSGVQLLSERAVAKMILANYCDISPDLHSNDIDIAGSGHNPLRIKSFGTVEEKLRAVKEVMGALKVLGIEFEINLKNIGPNGPVIGVSVHDHGQMLRALQEGRLFIGEMEGKTKAQTSQVHDESLVLAQAQKAQAPKK